MLPDTYAPLQNGTDWQIWITRDSGERVVSVVHADDPATNRRIVYFEYAYTGTGNNQQAQADSAVSFEYTQVINNVGSFKLTLPGAFDRRVLRRDNRVLFWRRPVGGAQSIAFMGLIRLVRTRLDRLGNTIYVVEGKSLEYLLTARVVAYYAGHARAEQTDQADDLMKAVVSQNLGSSATTGGGRKVNGALSSTYFSVQGDAAAGPSISKAFSYRNVLDVLRELADAARTAGTEVYFGMVPTSESTFEFRTKTGQWGQDRRSSQANGLTFGPDYGNMGQAELIEDATDEVNYAFGLGQGEGSAREIQTSTDTTRTGYSLWAVREGKVDARGEATAAAVLDAADAFLVKWRPYQLFTAELLSVPGYVYGKDWNFGDRVTIAFDGRQTDALIRAVTVSVDDQGFERVDPVVETYFTL